MMSSIGTALAVLALLVPGVCLARAGAAAAGLTEAWKRTGRVDGPVAAARGRVFLRSGRRVFCVGGADGKERWAKVLPEVVDLAAHGDRLFVLGRATLYALSASTGEVRDRRPSRAARALRVAGASLYLTDGRGVHRLEPGTLRQLASAKLAGGRHELLGAEGDRVLLLVRRARRARAGNSPRQLVVLDLASGERRYRFRLLREGETDLVRFAGGRLAFADRSPARRLLFFSDVDWTADRKLVDLTLSKLHRAAGERFSLALGGRSRRLFVARGGGKRPVVMALDLQRKRPLWKRRDLRPSGLYRVEASWASLLLVSGRGATGPSLLSVLDPGSGATRGRLALDGPISGPPLIGAGCLLVRTGRSVACFRPAPRAVPARPPVAIPPRPEPAAAWPVHDDRRIGFRLSLAPAWRQVRRHVQRLGRGRWSVPFVRYRREGRGGWSIEASIHLLVREAAGQQTAPFWRSVLAFRRAQDPGLRLHGRRRLVLANGASAIVGDYSMRGRRGRIERWRSLAVVHGGRAYELRAWVDPTRPLWPEVERMIRSFVPR